MNYINFYSDINCKNDVFTAWCGVAGFTGTFANLSNWTEITTHPEYATYRKQITAQNVLDGLAVLPETSQPLFDLSFSSARIYNDHYIVNDTKTNGGSAYRNAFFISTVNGENPYAVYLRMCAFSGAGLSGQDALIYFDLGWYSQEPEWIYGQRERWSYNPNGYGNTAGFQSQITIETPATSQFACVKLATVTIQEKQYYAFFFGVSASGGINPNLPCDCFLIPVVNFIDQIPAPYVGPVSKESADAAFQGSRYVGGVAPRDISGAKNPYGFNAHGVYLCEISEDTYHSIVANIYRGFSGNPLDKLGQLVSGLTTGNFNRPADEIKTMIDGVFCNHFVPVLGGYPSTGSVLASSICGYRLYDDEYTPTLKTVDPLQQENIEYGVVPRQTGNYLDFAPYTSVTLTIPILGDLDIDPAAILGNKLTLYFKIDLFSGVLSCDVCITHMSGAFAGTEYIYATMQGNCSVDMPIIGAGATGNPLLKIGSAVTSVATGGAAKAATAVFDLYDAAQTAAYSTPVKRAGTTNSAILVSPYKIYLTVTTPNNSNAKDFWSLAGIPSHMSGTVGSFSGYTVFEHIDLSGVSGATEAELDEIESTLKAGVWL